MTPATRGGKENRIRQSKQRRSKHGSPAGWGPVDRVFTDRASGKDTNRPQLRAALDYLRDGDVLVVHRHGPACPRHRSHLLQTVATLK